MPDEARSAVPWSIQRRARAVKRKVRRRAATLRRPSCAFVIRSISKSELVFDDFNFFARERIAQNGFIGRKAEVDEFGIKPEQLVDSRRRTECA
ncbi:hypothetical protein [Bradyrhizobium elkanii]|uniref:hypothetical protein n=1 Tax=Bradyrhizobium elkanii TaxID=29448 RepID=UPI0005709A93|nr:hypothetical protein [Bradyrhizobium elkanii]MCP1975540.1 hypothetical protein [Bradyrhizobium elkanii]MCS3482304.1 hypothetical protein [Bradyrhizobium elkanii]MCS3525010.1 hypothetical protein [Bradyrhizobium elkanii]MCS4075778.1 hypothetical protein [Bradyrhizobium elkanii]MCS4084973.1 hypothetical protein [Bradyrhizobium elkanii]